MNILSIQKAEKIQKVFRAINHKYRQQILKYLENKNAFSDESAINVTEIQIAMKDKSQSNISQHLKILLQQDIVKKRRQGKFIFYSLNGTILKRIKAVEICLENDVTMTLN